MTPRFDAGDIVDQEPVPIGPDDTSAEVQARVTRAAVTVLARRLEDLKRGTAPRRPQNEADATCFGRRRSEDGAIDWSRPAREVHDLVRAVSHPYPGAFAPLGGHRLVVWRSRVADEAAAGSPGSFAGDASRVRVACGDGTWLEILRAQVDDGPELDGPALARWLADRPREVTP